MLNSFSKNRLNDIDWKLDPLGEYRWFDVKGALNNLAEAVWIYGGKGRALSNQLLVPHWKACLAVIRRWDPQSKLPCDVRFAILGPVSTPRWNRSDKNIEVVAVRLQPEAVAAILDLKPGEILDRDIALEPEAGLDSVRRLAERGADATCVAKALVAYLAGQTDVSGKIDALTTAVAKLLRNTGGTARIGDVAESIGISERTMRRRFEQNIGVTPKYYARQARLKHVLLALDRVQHPDWSGFAHDFGYFDQAHMIDDMRALTGFGPSQLHAMRRVA